MEDNKGLVLFYFVLVRFEVSKITYIFTGWAAGFRILTEITDQSSPQTPQAQPFPRPHHAASRRLFGSPSGSFRLSSVCLFSDILFIQHCFPLWGRKLTIFFFKILKIFSLSPSRWIKTAGKIKRDLKPRRERRALEEGVCLWPLQQAALWRHPHSWTARDALNEACHFLQREAGPLNPHGNVGGLLWRHSVSSHSGTALGLAPQKAGCLLFK